MRRAAAVFGEWNGSASDAVAGDDAELTSNQTTIYLVDRPGAPQSVIRAVHSIVPRRHPDYFALLLANYVFGGQFSARLNQNLRQDKGYSYGYQSFVQWHRRPSLLVAGGSVQSNATGESVYETLKEFNEVQSDRPITAEELANAKDGILRAYPASFERPASVLGATGVYGAVRPARRLLPHRPPGAWRPSPWTTFTAPSNTHVRPGNLQIMVVGDRASVGGPAIRAWVCHCST